MIPTDTPVSAMNLAELIDHAIVSVTAARHGKAAKVNPTDTDAQRQLNELGLKQAASLYRSLKGLPIDVVVSSPLPRAMGTAQIATGRAPTPVEALGVDPNPELPVNIMFEALMYSPLIGEKAYFNHELAEHLKNWGRTALKELIAIAVQLREETGKPVHMMAFGHAVCSNILIWAIYEALGQEEKVPKSVTHVNLDEACALRLEINDGVLGITTITPAPVQ